jgi:hypothetical protein
MTQPLSRLKAGSAPLLLRLAPVPDFGETMAEVAACESKVAVVRKTSKIEAEAEAAEAVASR